MKTIERIKRTFENGLLKTEKIAIENMDLEKKEYRKGYYECEGIYYKSLKELSKSFGVCEEAIRKFIKTNYKKSFEELKEFEYKSKTIKYVENREILKPLSFWKHISEITGLEETCLYRTEKGVFLSYLFAQEDGKYYSLEDLSTKLYPVEYFIEVKYLPSNPL